MKEKIWAISIFTLIIGFVTANCLILQRQTDIIYSEIKSISIDDDRAIEQIRKIDEDFRKKEIYIGLTVSHDDLTNIEECFAELTGCLSVADLDGAEVAKCRLIRSLEHLRRLVGFNIDNII